jgi:formate dehydrogenase iron-sulfur subunit
MIKNPCILTDVTKCIGCEVCVAACKKINGLPAQDPPPRKGEKPGGLSADRWTAVIRRPGNHFVRKQCRHCNDPACVSVCPVGAMQKTPEGPVIYDKSLCMGCRYCMLGCPYGVPHYDWSSPAPSVRKCIMCYEAMKSGKITEPACVKACPEKATIFGTKSDMMAEAKKRLAAHPDKYINRIWGEKQVGGTSVLYLSDISLDFLGWQDSRYLTDKPLPERTWAALKPVPWEFLGMGALRAGIYWIIERRRKMARLAAAEENAPGENSAEDSHEE